jgi:hypothetical protein
LKRLLFLALLVTGVARAGTYPTGEELAQIRAAIHRQVEAPCGAAAPVTLARPVHVAFLGLVVLADEGVQEVRFTDRRGAVWLAYYLLERQQDGRWRMNGCRLAQPARGIPA